MAAIKGFFDESGDENDAQHGALAVAGYIGPGESWSTFDSDWRAVLSDFGVPYLHMREFQRRVGAFESWNVDDSEAEASLLSALAGAIENAKLRGCGAVTRPVPAA